MLCQEWEENLHRGGSLRKGGILRGSHSVLAGRGKVRKRYEGWNGALKNEGREGGRKAGGRAFEREVKERKMSA